MGIYVGLVQKKGYDDNVFYNYKPIYEIRNKTPVYLTPEEQASLLPLSEKGDINFSFNMAQREYMAKKFDDNQLVVFEFGLVDLQDNLKYDGTRNLTGYKVNAYEMIESGKIRKLDQEGIFHLVKRTEISSDFFNESIVELSSEHLTKDIQVFLEIDVDFYAGPYIVGLREIDKTFYVKPQIKENKYIIEGYKKSDCIIQEWSFEERAWSYSERRWHVIWLQSGAQKQLRDNIDDIDLLESFRESINNDCIEEGRIALSNLDTLLSHYKQSVLIGDQIPASVREDRFERLVTMLTSEAELDRTLSRISKSVSDLIVRYQNHPNVTELINTIVEKNPGFMEDIQSSKIIQEKIRNQEENLYHLEQKKQSVEEEIERMRADFEKYETNAIELKNANWYRWMQNMNKVIPSCNQFCRNLDSLQM